MASTFLQSANIYIYTLLEKRDNTLLLRVKAYETFLGCVFFLFSLSPSPSLSLLCLLLLLQFRITEWVQLERTTESPLVQSPCSSRVKPEHVAQECVLNVSNKGDSTTSVGDLFLCSHPHSDKVHIEEELLEHQFLSQCLLSFSFQKTKQ